MARVFGAILIVLGLSLLLLASVRPALAADDAPRASRKAKVHKARKVRDSGDGASCHRQRAQRFLIRGNFMQNGMLLGKEHQRALRWRVEQYGWVEGVGLESLNSQSAFSQAKSVKFFGLPLTVHEKVAEPLRCVEQRIRKRCTKEDSRYVPRAVGGFRQGNTYRQGEVSNHMFGIAVDIDPDRNPCCGCVAPWPEHKLCRDPERSIYEKTSLPRCWIDSFERYGFYWLGRDRLQDTMHFEYLGDPEAF